MSLRTSDAGRAFIEAHEGCRLAAYRDGAGIWTIGYGHTNGVAPGMVIDRAQADAFLSADLVAVERCIERTVSVPLAQNRFDALADFIFNVGGGAFASSTLRRLLNAGDVEGAADQFGRWIHDANGTVEPGLVTRRADERALFEGKYND
jgi:lysozyme